MKQSDPFIDEAELALSAGRGGDGLVCFRREKFVARGGPNGGDGGRGGDVVLVADRNLATLRDQRYRTEIEAERGQDGGPRNMAGSNGADAIVTLPVGTVVYALPGASDEPLVDLVEDGQRFVVAKGGSGGFGNARFTTPTRQAPDFALPGREGERLRVRLSLKLIADVGLVGLPNAGKSTLLRRLTAARPRVADYPFTTLTPNLGVADWHDQRFVLADIPGLIEGASEGTGLGDRFLRHVERTRVLVHVLDGAAILDEGRDLLAEYQTIRKELEAYDAGLGQRRELVLINKIDLQPDAAPWDALESAFAQRGVPVLRASAATGAGVPELLAALAALLEEEARDGKA